MASMETLVTRKITLKLKCTPIDSERKACQSGQKAEVPVLSGCNKRKLDLEVPDQMDKRRKMDPGMKRQCGFILDILLGHPHAPVFKSPVDPVALKIPDYFSIISRPMDLGTIKSKLARNSYFTAEGFAADVHLTFSNAMLYNPPNNYVHHMAKELESIFIQQWKLFEKKWNKNTAIAQQGILPPGDNGSALVSGENGSSNSGRSSFHQRSYGQSSPLNSIKITKLGEDSGKACCEKTNVKSCFVETATKPSMSSEEKSKLKKDLMEMLVGSLSQKLQSWFKKLGIQCWKKEVVALEFDKFHDDVLWQLKKLLKDAKENVGKNPSTKVIGSGRKSRGSATDTEEERPLPRSNHLDPVVVTTSGEGQTHVLLDPVPATTSSERQTSGLVDEQDNLKKALRVAMLKKRFAVTICKANSGNADSENVQQEIERLQREEAQVKELLRNEELKKMAQREKEREAARLGLEMMKRTVELEDNLLAFRELEKLCGCFVDYERGSRVVLRYLNTGKVVNPLEPLGWHLKEDFIADERGELNENNTSLNCEKEEGEVEEGEILD